jgi:hypothetical protein
MRVIDVSITLQTRRPALPSDLTLREPTWLNRIPPALPHSPLTGGKLVIRRNKVSRQSRAVRLDGWGAKDSFAADLYIRQHRVRSVLGLPLLT